MTSIAAAGSHTCAVTTDGAAKCWGSNSSGQLGDGSGNHRNNKPEPVSGFGFGVASIAAGGSHTCAVTTGGAAKCWGRNAEGQLGNGSTTNRSTPVDVSF